MTAAPKQCCVEDIIDRRALSEEGRDPECLSVKQVFLSQTSGCTLSSSAPTYPRSSQGGTPDG